MTIFLYILMYFLAKGTLGGAVRITDGYVRDR